MKLISWNVCGIKNRYNDGTLDKIFNLNPDIFCLQEVHQKPRNLDKNILYREGYNSFFYPSVKYDRSSGVATYTNSEPISLKNGFCNKFDDEGRIQRLEFENFNLYNVYFPTGDDKSNSEKNKDKIEFYELFTKYVMKSKKPQIICGDFNRISTINDTYHERYSRNGFKKEEKKWFEDFLDSGFIDSFRLFNEDGGNYTWWSNQKTLQEENKGFRFDYFLVNEELKDNITNATILCDINNKDHAPISLEMVF